MDSLHTVIAMWLNASQKSHVGVGMNRSAKGSSNDPINQPNGTLLDPI